MRLKMMYGKKIIIIILILLVLGLHFPPLISAKQGLFVTQPAAATGITKHPPELLALPGTSTDDYGTGIAVDSSGKCHLTGYSMGDLGGQLNAGDLGKRTHFKFSGILEKILVFFQCFRYTLKM